MQNTYFYIPAASQGNQITEGHTQLSNFMNTYEKDHSIITGKPYLGAEKNETENTETGNSDFISFYDFFGAVNY